MIDVDKIISAYVKAEPNANHSEIASMILEEHEGIGLAHRTLRSRISRYRNNTDGIQADVKKGEPKYHVSEDIYYIYRKEGTVKMPVSLIDDIFTDYSKFGYGLTQDEVAAKYDLKPHEWLAIKNALGLFKTSNIISPHTLETHSKEELEKLIELRMDKLFRNKGAIVKKYRHTLERNYKRVIEKESFREAEVMHLINEMYEHLDIITDQKYIVPMSQTYKNDIGIVVISDLHNGAKIKANNISHFTMANLSNALKETADIVNSYQYKEVHLFILGDLVHNYVGDMHDEMWKETDIEEGVGGKLVNNTVRTLADFCTQIVNIKSIHGVDGNHDRSGKAKSRIEYDLPIMIYFMLDTMIGRFIDVVHHGKRGLVVIDGINYILSHGEEPFDNKDVYRMINRFGNPRGFTLVLKGHKHSRMIKSADDNYDNRRLNCPSYFTFDSYTESLGFASAAGFLVIEKGFINHDINLPLIHDHTIRI